MIIEDIPIIAPVRGGGLTNTLRSMNVGQSVLVDLSYQYIHATIRQAGRSVKNPLVGQFAIVPEGRKFRVGRVG